LANDTVGLLDAQGIKKAHFVGASMAFLVFLTVASAKSPLVAMVWMSSVPLPLLVFALLVRLRVLA
jgi:hypothetical protein